MHARLLQLLTIVWLGGAACSQGRGESCQVDRDCDDGLQCFNSGGERATCERPGEGDAGRPPVVEDSGLRDDPGAPADGGLVDSGVADAAVEEDGG